MTDIEDLPPVVPIFPLQGALLLPGGTMPLHIFEPRYREMTADALAGDRYIGMIQPRRKEAVDNADSPDVYTTGCIGRISAHKELEDGRYLLSLTGVCRFRVVRELPLRKGYRRAEADYEPFACDLSHPDLDKFRDRVLNAFATYLQRRNLSTDWEAIGKAPSDELFATIAMICPFAPNEKQALMEAPDPKSRAELLAALLEMDAGGTGETDAVKH